MHVTVMVPMTDFTSLYMLDIGCCKDLWDLMLSVQTHAFVKILSRLSCTLHIDSHRRTIGRGWTGQLMPFGKDKVVNGAG